jgi:hypothetical protein
MRDMSVFLLLVYSVRSRTNSPLMYHFLCLPECTIYSFMSTSSQATRFEKSVRDVKYWVFTAVYRMSLETSASSHFHCNLLCWAETLRQFY